MAITAVGFTDTIANEVQWAKMWAIVAPGGQVVDNGFTPAAATGTRIVSIAAGDLVAAGVYVNNSASANVTISANSSGQSRIDIVVLAINWSADTATLTTVNGTASANPVAPALTQTAGTTWHVPLAQVLVRNGVTQIAAADVTDLRPLYPHPKLYTPTVSQLSIGPNAASRIIATRTIPDPGRTWRARVSGLVEMNTVSNGRGNISVEIDGITLFTGRAANNNAGPAIVPATLSGTMTGAHTVTLSMVPFNMSSPDQLSSQAGSSFQIEVVPS